MQAFNHWRGCVAPLMRANIDTDQIIPKQFLTTVTRAGLGDYLFDSWRFTDPGEPGKRPPDRQKNPDFVFNQPQYADASILLAGKNFGCGSSREHAAWSLLDYGIRVVIAPDFADIFHANAITNGLLPAVVEAEEAERLAELIARDPAIECLVDLPTQRISCGDMAMDFHIDEGNKTRLLKGLDAIGLTLEHTEDIRAFEKQHLSKHPWLAGDITAG